MVPRRAEYANLKDSYCAPKITWRAGWDTAAEMYFNLIETSIFGYTHDASLKATIKNRKDILTMVSQSPFLEIFDEIEEQVKTDVAKKKEAQAAQMQTGLGDEKKDEDPKVPEDPAALLKESFVCIVDEKSAESLAVLGLFACHFGLVCASL